MSTSRQLIDAFKFSEYAHYFGYSDDQAGIEAAQRMAGLPVTGNLDPMTVNVLARAPRCGVSDAQAVSGRVDRWKPGMVVTYHVAGFPTESGLSKEQILAVVDRCAAAWSAVAGIQFRRIADQGNANIVLNKGRGKSAGFDGPSGTLAWAQLPQGDAFQGQLQCRWDMDEQWTDDPRANGIQLFNTTNHEWGHLIGHYHNNVKAQLLNPTYNPRIAVPQSFDIEEAVARYGPPLPGSTPEPPGSDPAQPPTAGAYPLKTLILMSDGRTYGFKNGVLVPQALTEDTANPWGDL